MTQRRIFIQRCHDSFLKLNISKTKSNDFDGGLPVTAPTPINGATVEPLNQD